MGIQTLLRGVKHKSASLSKATTARPAEVGMPLLANPSETTGKTFGVLGDYIIITGGTNAPKKTEEQHSSAP